MNKRIPLSNEKSKLILSNVSHKMADCKYKMLWSYTCDNDECWKLYWIDCYSDI